MNLLLPSPHVRDQLSPPQEESKGMTTLFSLSHTMAPVPIKTLPEFLIWLLINSYWLTVQEPKSVEATRKLILPSRLNQWGWKLVDNCFLFHVLGRLSIVGDSSEGPHWDWVPHAHSGNQFNNMPYFSFCFILPNHQFLFHSFFDCCCNKLPQI